MPGQCGSRTFNEEIQNNFLSYDKWRDEGRCPLTFFDGVFRYCAVEGKLSGTNPTLKSDPAYTNCSGLIRECPYKKPKIQSLLTRKIVLLDEKFKNKLEDLIQTRDSIREEEILSRRQ